MATGFIVQLVVSALSFAFGLLFVPILVPGMRVRGTTEVVQVGLVCGLLSAVLSKVLLAVLSLVFLLPILLAGPLGPFIVQTGVNAGLLFAASRYTDAVAFDSLKTTGYAALALTALQTLVRLAG
jgi:uncharacterized membrane protein YvlD (DUF360 family)